MRSLQATAMSRLKDRGPGGAEILHRNADAPAACRATQHSPCPRANCRLSSKAGVTERTGGLSRSRERGSEPVVAKRGRALLSSRTSTLDPGARTSSMAGTCRGGCGVTGLRRMRFAANVRSDSGQIGPSPAWGARGRKLYQGTGPFSSTNAPVGASPSALAIRTTISAPCSTGFVPRWPLKSVAV